MAKKKILETAIAVVLAFALAGSGFWLGWSAGRQAPENIVVSGLSNMTPNGSTTAPADFGIFWQAWQDINDLYLRNPSTTDAAKVQGAVAGLVSSLGDPYTEYFSPSGNTQFQQDITGDFGGIGAELGANGDGELVIIAPLAGTPAAEAGLKAGDQIVDINGSSTAALSVDDAVSAIRGPVGSKVMLTIMRDGFAKPQDFTITRETINVPNVQFAMKGDVAVITLSEFTQDADFEFYQALVKAVAANAKGIVLDLRDDPGGYLEVAVDIAGYFVKPGTLVVKEVGRTVPEQDFTASGDGSLSTFPLVVLMDSGSASAAEILAGALHDDRGTPLVGTQSFGKGTVQQLEPLSDGSSIKITVAHWVLPSGKIIDHEGLTPDYAVSSTLSATSTVDAQLDKALQVIQEQIGK
ncbi:MAG TPA: S41 family peptidase [Candidatus Paceibacterota bacterium]|nr:S41 family peptidase [Candidatus Paceibacterota bacterium]